MTIQSNLSIWNDYKTLLNRHMVTYNDCMCHKMYKNTAVEFVAAVDTMHMDLVGIVCSWCGL